MSKSEQSTEVVGETFERWGYKFKWTDQHMSQASMSPLRFEYDRLGATALEKLQKIHEGQRATATNQTTNAPNERPAKDLYALLRDNYQNDPVLTELWKSTHHVPEWVDWAQLARGQEFFHRYIGANITGFALQGFMGENSVRYSCDSHSLSSRMKHNSLLC